MAVSVPRRLFTVDEYYKMAKVGILKPDERVELLDGEIVRMNAIGSPHAWCVIRLNRQFSAFPDQCLVSVQAPLRLGDRSEPEPDIVLLQLDTPEDRHPQPQDVFLVIEVADSSIQIDRRRKLPMYARAGIPEYWIVDLNADRIEVYRDPLRARYRSVSILGRGSTVSPSFAPDLVVDVSRILGQARAEQE
ncbi:MAG: Uma2 family endonuclease [Chloroflexota bacterium]